MEKKQKGTFVNLVNFPPIRPGKEAEFLEWFRWTNELYAKHKGFISRTLLKPTEGSPNYAAIVEHASKESFMAMHLSKDREEAFKRVEPLFEGNPTPHFYEVVISLARSEEKEAPNRFKRPLQLIENSNLKIFHFGGIRKEKRL